MWYLGGINALLKMCSTMSIAAISARREDIFECKEAEKAQFKGLCKALLAGIPGTTSPTVLLHGTWSKVHVGCACLNDESEIIAKHGRQRHGLRIGCLAVGPKSVWALKKFDSMPAVDIERRLGRCSKSKIFCVMYSLILVQVHIMNFGSKMKLWFKKWCSGHLFNILWPLKFQVYMSSHSAQNTRNKKSHLKTIFLCILPFLLSSHVSYFFGW